MSEQAEFFKTVREGFTAVQEKASARIEALEGDAKKALSELVAKGKVSPKDLIDRLSKVQGKVKPAAEEAWRKVSHAEYRQTLDELTRRVQKTREKARSFVDSTGREQAVALAGELRRFAERLEKLAKKAEGPAGEPPVAEKSAEETPRA